MKRVSILTLCFILAAASIAGTAATITVGPGGGYDHATIQAAIDVSTTGDTVIVHPGTYVENIDFKGRSIILRGTNPTDPATVDATIIDGNGAGPVVTFAGTENSSCVLSGFTVRNGYWHDLPAGGGIRGRQTRATIQDNVITKNRSATFGGGLGDCDGLIQNNVIIGNSALDGGGVFGCDGVVRNNLIAGNTATNGGGGLGFCNAAVQNATVINNTSNLPGGGVYSFHGDMRNCIVWGNVAGGSGEQIAQSSRDPSFSCIQGWTGGGQGNTGADPRFVSGPFGDFYLSQTAAGQTVQSPCVDSGSGWAEDLGLGDRATRSDGGPDTGVVDMGYHYPTPVPPPPPPRFSVEPTSFSITALEGDPTTLGRTLEVRNIGAGTMRYQITVDPWWLMTVTPTAVQLTGASFTHDVDFVTLSLLTGTFRGTITVTGNATNSPVSIPVEVTVNPAEPPDRYVLDWSTYLGGTRADAGAAVAVDGTGSVVVGGRTDGGDFPAVAGYDRTFNGGTDGFVARFRPDGTLAWSTFLGGRATEEVKDVAVDDAQNVYVIGHTTSTDFPRVGGSGRPHQGGTDIFMTKFDGQGAVVWSMLLGGSEDDQGEGIAVDAAGNIHVCGHSYSADFPTTRGYDATLNAPADAFVAKLDTTGTLLWSTYLGGSAGDFASDIALDGSAAVYVRGNTWSADFPTPNGHDTTLDGTADVFLSKFGATGQFLWSTYFGGGSVEGGAGLAVSDTYDVYVTGGSSSPDLPGLAGHDTTHNGGVDVFAARFAADGQLRWSTFLGGTNTESGNDVATDGFGDVYITGYTQSADYPTKSRIETHHGGMQDAFVSVLSPDGNLRWSRFLGGMAWEYGPGITADTRGNIYATGSTNSTDFPTANGWDRVFNGGTADAYVVKFAEHIGDMPKIAHRPPSFSLTAGYHDLTTLTRTLYLWNGGGGLLKYDVTASPWLLEVTPTSGKVSTTTHPVLVNFVTYALDPGTYSGGIVITANADNSPVRVPVTVTINPPPSTYRSQLKWSTYLGGSDADDGGDIAVDKAGNAYVTGSAASDDFPTSGMSDPRFGPQRGGFISKFDTGGALVWSAPLGGTNSGSAGLAIALDDGGAIVVAGKTSTDDFPTTAAFDPAYNGGTDAFVTKIGEDGLLLWSTFLGGGAEDVARDAAVAGDGSVCIVGSTGSGDFPAFGGYDTTHNGDRDGFVCRFLPDGTLLWATFLGGSSADFAYGVGTDGGGNVYVCGTAASADFPTSGPFQRPPGGERDGFVSKFSAGGALLWSTLLGGSMWDAAQGIAVGDAGDVYVTGWTNSADFLATATAGGSRNGDDVFAVKLAPDGEILWSALFGGTDPDSGEAIALDSSGAIYVAGSTYSSDFPSEGTTDLAFGGLIDSFVAKLDPDGSLVCSTLLGGASIEQANGISLDRYGGVYIAGETRSPDFPTRDAFDPTLGGTADAFVAKLAQRDPAAPPSIRVWPASCATTAQWHDPSTLTQTLEIWNAGGGTLQYDVAVDPWWLFRVSPAAAQSTDAANRHVLDFVTLTLNPGTYHGTVTITGNADNSPVTIPVKVTVTIAGTTGVRLWRRYE